MSNIKRQAASDTVTMQQTLGTFAVYDLLPEIAPRQQAVYLCALVVRLEVIDGTDDADDIGGGANVAHDIIHGLVDHRAFVKGIPGNRGRIDTLHLGLELGQSKTLLGG